jgi:carboxymethylenebutenolidase
MKRLMMVVGALLIAAPAWAQGGAPPPAGAPAGAPGGGRQGGGPPPIDVPYNDAIPAGTADHATRALKESPRHGEWVNIKMADGTNLNSWVVYPEIATKTGVVLVIHDINGMRDLARALGDQLAQDGFIAIVPDFLSGKGPNGGGTESLGSGVGAAIRDLTPADVNARLNAAMEYGKKLPASNGKTGVVGFCWGGARSFGFAAAQPNLNASVVYYGEAPGSGDNTLDTALANLKAPVLGNYAGNDARIGATVPGTVDAMKKLGKTYETYTYEGAGHGFMFAQAGAAGANLKAAAESWPRTIAWFKKYLQ